MTTADEILAGAVEATSEGATQDKVLHIDNELRTISIPSTVKLLGVESDEDVNVIEFEMPRHYGEVDLSTFSVRVNYMNANGDGDIYKVTDLVADEEKMTFSWLVGRTALRYKGDTRFIVCLKKLAEDFVVKQEFNTTVASLPVLQGLEPDQQLIQRYPDIIEQMLKFMETPISSEEISKAVEEYLKKNPVGWATINDEEVSAGSVWSSQKTSTQIDGKVSDHNTDPNAHTDVRELISGLTNRLNALADSDDTTLDQLSEIVAYIKSNKTLIDAITTNKVSVSDIVDDLITNSPNKPLSAAQGIKLKALIDAIVPITVDSALSSTSTNPVQNKVVFNGLNDKEDKGAARSIQIGSNSYTPNKSGVIDLSSMTAANSSKLAGKAPEYYIQPYNLLDNSDFVRPVSQLPMNSWHGNANYAIDRWNLTSGATVSQAADGLKIVSDKTSWTAGIQQRIEAKRFADVMTLAVRGVFPVACRLFVYIGSGTVNFGTAYFEGDAAERTLLLKLTKPDGLTGDEVVNVYISPDTGSTGTAAVVRWAALYEGEYTAETLPPYVPKGYAAELAECKWYFQVVLTNKQAFPGYCANGTAYCFINIQTMRVAPTVIPTGKFYYTLGNKQNTSIENATNSKANTNQVVIKCVIPETSILTGVITPQGTIYITAEL